MHKPYIINDKQSVVLDSSAGWLYIYKDYFGRDILPDLLPILEGVLDAIANIVGVAEGDTVEDVVKAIISPEVIDDIFIDLAGIEATTILNIFWSMAKNEDPSIEAPEKFFKQFDILPMDEIAPKLFSQIINSTISSKNLERLQTKVPFLQMTF